MRFSSFMVRVATLSLLCSCPVMAASHSVIPLPEHVSEWPSPTVSLRWVDSLAVSGVSTDGTLKTQWLKRGARGFAPSTYGPGLPLASLPSFSGANTYRLLGSHADLNSLYHLTAGLSCSGEGSACPATAYVLSTHTDQGLLHNAKTKTPVVEIPSEPGCGSTPSLWPWDQGVAIFDGCAHLYYFDATLSIKSTQTLPASFHGDAWKLFRTPSYDLTDPSAAKPVPSTVFAGRLSQGQWQRFRLLSDKMEPEWLSPLPVDASVKRCDWFSVSPSRIVCQGEDDSLFVVEEGSSVTQTLSDSVSPQDPEGRSLHTHGWAAFAQKAHAFILRAQTITDPQPQPTDPAAPPVPPVLSEGLRVSNLRVADGARYQVFVHEAEGKDLPFAVVLPYRRDPAHYYAVALLKQSGKYWLSVQDHITQDQSPRWIQSVGAIMGSGTEQELPLLYDDDNHLPDEIVLNLGSAPSWAQLSESSPRKLLLSPEHADAGVFRWQLSIAQTNDLNKKTDLDAEIRVLLSPYQITLFEAELFKKIGVDKPVALPSLLKALGGRLRLLENDPLIFQLALEGRTLDEVNIDIQNVPPFLQWDPQNAQLRGTPDQIDVNRYPDMIVRTQDRYAPIDPETGEPVWDTIAFPMEVLQIDDPVTIISEPPLKAQVDLKYVYALKTRDEETEQSAMNIRLGSAPSWLTFDNATDTLTGTPSVRDVGTHRVQLMISDGGGHVVVHSFDVAVENPEQLKESGGAGIGVTGWLLLTLAGWRHIRRKSM